LKGLNNEVSTILDKINLNGRFANLSFFASLQSAEPQSLGNKKLNVWKHLTCPPIPPRSRIFGVVGLRWQTYGHFARHLAAESAGGSVPRHAFPIRTARAKRSKENFPCRLKQNHWHIGISD
jgi:hypothetical protein